jgi:hypothetical protein
MTRQIDVELREWMALDSADRFRRGVKATAKRLRDLADRIEVDGREDRYGETDFLGAAQRVVHEATWGIANLDLAGLVREAGEALAAKRLYLEEVT